MNTTPQTYNKQNPFIASIKDRYPLCKTGSEKHTQHVVLDISRSGMTYNVGDSVAVFPLQDAHLVQLTLNAMHANGDEMIIEKHTGEAFPLREFLTKRVTITDFSRKLVQEIKERQTDSAKKEHLAFILADGNKDAFKEYQKNHELWDLLKENSEARFDIQELCNLLMPMMPRFYSIASSMKTVGEEIHLTVSYVRYISNGHMRFGVCSHYLCDMAALHQPNTPIYIQPNHGFTLPANPEAAMIMIGPGTGIAPYRGFVQERMTEGSTGKNWLFFGEWTREHEYFYGDYWEKLRSEKKMQVDLAFSRDQEHKVYVQHRMLEKGAELYEWLKNGAYLFVCGDAHRMAKDVDAALHKIVEIHGNMDEAASKAYVKQLRAEKRYLRDVY